MEQQRTTVQKTGTYYGIMTGVAAIIYIVLVKLLGLIENVSLHFLVGIVLVIGVIMAIKSHKSRKHGRIDYLEGIGVGFFVGLVSAVVYTLFQVLMDSVFHLAFSYPYRADESYGDQQAIWILGITWILMGIILGTFIGFIGMQFFKRPDHKLSS
ncbi:DUF4199 domain-containing protein [Rufibacter soli]